MLRRRQNKQLGASALGPVTGRPQPQGRTGSQAFRHRKPEAGKSAVAGPDPPQGTTKAEQHCYMEISPPGR